MLVLSRKQNQEIVIGDGIKITVLKIKGNTIRLGIEAPRDVKVIRGELSPLPENNQTESGREANVTVVFSNDPSNPKPNVDVIPFRNPELKNSDLGNAKNVSECQTSLGEATQSFSFRAQLPKTLQHNRLKELVKQVTRHH